MGTEKKQRYVILKEDGSAQYGRSINDISSLTSIDRRTLENHFKKFGRYRDEKYEIRILEGIK